VHCVSPFADPADGNVYVAPQLTRAEREKTARLTCSGSTKYTDERDANGGESLSRGCAFLDLTTCGAEEKGGPGNKNDAPE
jgi:hypothetical protein